MGVKPVPFFSSVLYSRKTCFVYVPDEYETSGRAYPVIYLLHGLYGDETSWIVKGAVRETLDRMIGSGELRDCIVVMPNDGGYGHGTFYTDWYDGTGAFEQYFIHDLVGFIDTHFRTLRSKEARAAAGLSMGGFGAIYLALRHPDMFGSAASMSGALGSPEGMPYKDYTRSDFPRMFGPANGPYARERDIYRLAALRLGKDLLPALYFDCGTEDYLHPMNLAFHTHLEAIGYPHRFREFPGGHEWDYWTGHLPDTLRFFEQRFRATM